MLAIFTLHNSACFRSTNSAPARRTPTVADDGNRSGYATTEAASSDNDDDHIGSVTNEDSGEPTTATTGRRTASDEKQHVAAESTPATTAAGRTAAERAGPDTPPGVGRENYPVESGDDAKVDADDAGCRADVTDSHDARGHCAAHRVDSVATWWSDNITAASSDSRSKRTLEADGIADDIRSDADVGGSIG